MRFSHKIAKLADPRTYRSARRHLRRVLLMRRFVYGLDADDIIATMDREKFQAIYDRYAVENPGAAWPKYLELKPWMETNLRRVRELELDFGPRRDILDLGSGAGYFLYICKWLGHRPVGLDIDEVPMYSEMARILGLERMVWQIDPFVPLPDLGRKFDLITAFMICFNNHNREGHWGLAEWDFFLSDITRHLKPRGRVWLALNRQLDGSFMTDAMKELFEDCGAEIKRHEVIFNKPPRPAILARPVAR